MPIIDGYDDLDLGPSGLSAGIHKNATVTACKYETGTAQSGKSWAAVDATIESGTQSEKVRVWIPVNTAEWQSWSEGRRKVTKGNLTGLGLNMADVESDSARAGVIGKTVEVEVKPNGEYRNIYIREAGGMDSAGSLPEPTVPLEGAAVSTPTTAGQPVIV